MYDLEIRQASQITGVEPALIAAIIMQESSWKPNVSYKDTDGGSSYGLMQVRLGTARGMLQEPDLTSKILAKPYTNILAGAHYLRRSFLKWRDIRDVVASYNAGKPRKNVLGQYTNSKGVTNVDKYVKRVMRFYKEYKSGAEFKPLHLVDLKSSPLLFISVLGLGVVGLIYIKGR